MLPGAIPVRDAGPADAEALAALFGQLGYPACADEVRVRLAARSGPCAHNFARTLVAEHAGVVAGVIVLNLIEPVHVPGRWAMVSALVVDAALRGAGVGARLLDEAEQYARGQGCSRIELSSSEGRTGAHLFYERQGYGEVRKRFVKPLAAAANRADRQ